MWGYNDYIHNNHNQLRRCIMKNTETYIGTINVKSAIKTFDEISQVFYQRKTNRYNKPVGSFSSHKQYFLVDRDATTGQWVSRKNLRKVAI